MVAVMQGSANPLETNVRNELSIRAPQSGADIHVKADNGSVKLTGAVDCYAKKLLAESAAAHVVGVREVVNELQVMSDGVYGFRNIDLMARHSHVHLLPSFSRLAPPLGCALYAY